ncbi:MAG: response regulator transcription factor [Bacteroidia bacterium]|nr:response regulator transcription factor [Bacteroidia bacterium]
MDVSLHSKIKVAIIDDSLLSITAIKKLLEKFNDTIDISFTSTNANDSLLQLSNNKIDILFLDIEMPLFNGFEILEKIGQYSFLVVFTTAHENYALQAFKIHAFDYLIKPIEKNQLEDIIKRYFERVNFNKKISLNQNKKPDSNVLEANGRLIIDTHGKTFFVNISNIQYFKAERAYSKIYYNNSNILVSKNTNYFEKLLNNPCFYRIHRSFLININQVKEFVKKNNSYFVIMNNGDELAIAKQNKKELLSKLQFQN